MRKVIISALMGVLLCAVPTTAQEQRAAIEGIVKDSQGAVLPGVTVEARSLQGAVVSTVTEGNGVYRFPALAPGVYAVTAELAGFQIAKVESVELTLGTIKTIGFTLQIASVTEEVVVTGEAPLVDTKQSARATSLRSDQFELLPKGRDFSSLVTQAAGANNEAKLGGISIDGSSASENRYIVDGVETTDIVQGAVSQGVNSDFVEEVQIKSSGYTAEYGGATGGVISVVTKSGSNDIRGMGIFYWSGDKIEGGRYTNAAETIAAGGRETLRLSPTNSNVAEYVSYPEDSYNRYEPGFWIGGPLRKDRAWFWAAYQPRLQDTERTVTFRLDNSTGTFEQKRRVQNVSANQTAQISDKLRTRAAFNLEYGKVTGLLPALDGSSTPVANFGKATKTPNYTVSGQADYVANHKMYFGVRAGYSRRNTTDDTVRDGALSWFRTSNVGFAGLDGTVVPTSLQRVTNFQTDIDNNLSVKDVRTRLNFQGDATYYASFAGQHTFKAGVQVDRMANQVDTGQLGNIVNLYWGRTLGGRRGNYGYYRVRSNGVDPKRGIVTTGDVSVNNVGLFIQDAWTINNKLTINVGLRTESEEVPAFSTEGGSSSTPITFGFADKLAPRVGAAYDIFGDGKWKVYGSWGIFYDIFKMELPRGSFGGDKWLEYYYTLDTYDWTSLTNGASCPPACPGTLLQTVDFRHSSVDAIDPDMKPYRQQEAVFGFEHQLTNRIALQARYVHKQLDRGVDDIGQLDASGNEIYSIGNPGYGQSELFLPDGGTTAITLPKAQRDYDAVEVAVNRMLADNWSLRASYQWSRLYGNYTGLSQGDENGRTSPNVGRAYDYPLIMFAQDGEPVLGPLPTDRPHQFKAQAIYVLPFGTAIGLNQYVASGIPITREAAVYPSSQFPVQYLGRGSDGRTDVLSQTDLYVQHEFKAFGDRRIQVSLNVLNLFDQKAAAGVYVLQTAAGVGLNIDEPAFFAGQLNFQQLLTAQNATIDPRFLQANSFQTPIAARVGVKFIF